MNTKQTRKQLAALLRRHYGAKAEIARRYRMGRSSITNWLAGRTRGQRVERAIRGYVAWLLRHEVKR